MSILAHSIGAAPGADFEAYRRALDSTIRAEVIEAKRIQQQTGCAWGEALRQARQPNPPVPLVAPGRR